MLEESHCFDMSRQNIVFRYLSAFSAIFVAASTAGVAHGHHSPSSYDPAAEVVVSGVVSNYEWANPHVYIFLETPTDGGNRERWRIEGAAPAMMRRRGWTSESLSIGDAVTVRGNPGRNGRRIIRLIGLSTEDGVELSNRALQFDAPSEKISSTTSLAGIWVAEGRGSAWRVFTNPKSLPLTSRGLTALGEFDERDSNGIHCIPYTVPMMMLLPDVKSIEILPGVVRIRGEFDDTVRTIDMNASSHDRAAPSYLGHSIGRWEGDTLVIDTAAYLPHAQGIATGLASSPLKHTVERLSLDADGLSFTYSVFLEDAEQLASPVSGEMIYHYRPDLSFAGLKCDPDNARRFLETEPGRVRD